MAGDSGNSGDGMAEDGMLSVGEVRHVARLARLDLTSDELERMRGELSAILRWVSQLEAVEADGPPLLAIGGETQRMRDDDPAGPCDREGVLRNAPDRLGDWFSVPRVIE